MDAEEELGGGGLWDGDRLVEEVGGGTGGVEADGAHGFGEGRGHFDGGCVFVGVVGGVEVFRFDWRYFNATDCEIEDV